MYFCARVSWWLLVNIDSILLYFALLSDIVMHGSQTLFSNVFITLWFNLNALSCISVYLFVGNFDQLQQYCESSYFCRRIVENCCAVIHSHVALSGIDVAGRCFYNRLSWRLCWNIESIAKHSCRHKSIEGRCRRHECLTIFDVWLCDWRRTATASALWQPSPPLSEARSANSTLIVRVLCTRCPTSGNYLILSF